MKAHAVQFFAGLCAGAVFSLSPSANSAEIMFEIISVQATGNGSFAIHHVDPDWASYNSVATVGAGSRDRFGFMVAAGASAFAYNSSSSQTMAWDVRIKQIRDLGGFDIEAIGSGLQQDTIQMRDIQQIGTTSVGVASSVHVNAARESPTPVSVTLIDDGFSASCSSDCGADTGEATLPIYSYNQVRSDKDVGTELPPTGRFGTIWRLWGDVTASVSQSGFNTFGSAIAQATDRLQLVSGAPEPGTGVLLCTALGGLAWSLRKRRVRV